MGEISLSNVLISIAITAAAYMIYPWIMVVICKKRYTKEEAKKMALWNSIIVGGIFLVVTTALYGVNVWNAMPAFLYYYINSSVWVSKENTPEVTIKVKENKDNKISLIPVEKSDDINDVTCKNYENMLILYQQYGELTKYCAEQGATKPINFNYVVEELETIEEPVKRIDSSMKSIISDEKLHIDTKKAANIFYEMVKLDLEVNKKLLDKANGNLLNYTYSENKKDNNKLNKYNDELFEYLNNIIPNDITEQEEMENEIDEPEEEINEDNSSFEQKYTDLNKLKELLDNNIITKEEFEKEKKKILK